MSRAPKFHTHLAVTSSTRPFSGPVARNEKLAAHGGVCHVYRCACGAIQRVNVNGQHIEVGAWIEASKGQARA